MAFRFRRWPRPRFWQAALLGFQGGRGGAAQTGPGAAPGTPGTGQDTTHWLVDGLGIPLVDGTNVELTEPGY